MMLGFNLQVSYLRGLSQGLKYGLFMHWNFLIPQSNSVVRALSSIQEPLVGVGLAIVSIHSETNTMLDTGTQSYWPASSS